MHPQAFEIRLLGPLEVRAGDEVRELPRSRKARALLAYLVATGQPHSRSALCDLFWPEVRDPRAGLRWALSKARGTLEPDHGRLETFRDQVRFPWAGVQVDTRQVEAAVGADPGEASTEALLSAVGVFRGEFLEGLELPECHGYQTWCLGMRERFRGLHGAIRARLVRRLREDAEAALPHALARLSLDPLSDEAAMDAMELLADLGRVQEALDVYDQCRRVLLKQVHREPSSALELLRHRLTSETWKAARPVGGDVGNAPSPAGPPEISSKEPTLVGRDRERESIRALVEGAERGSGKVIWVTGEPGIGKTRLLRETARVVRDSGGWVLWGQAFEGEEVRPYGPWIQALRAVPEAALAGGLREELCGLVPGTMPRGGIPREITERVHLFDGVARLLTRLADERVPGLVVLDDVHWLDEASAALLHYLTRTLEPSVPVLFACAARAEEMDVASNVSRVVRSLERCARIHRIPLRRLDLQATEALVSEVGQVPDHVRVFEVSEGNPMFALEIARSLREGRDTTPATIEEELDARLERLGSEALSVIPWAAALGRAFDVPTLARAMDQPAHLVVDAIDTLERRGIVRASAADRYDFTHSLLRQAAYRRSSEPVRRTIHRRIADVLAEAKGRDGRLPGAIAHHAVLGGLPALAARACIEAAEGSVWLFAFEEAAKLTELGLSQVEALAEAERLPLQMDLLHVYARLSMRPLRPPDLERRVSQATREAQAAGLTDVVAQGHFYLAALQYQRGAYEDTQRNSARSAVAARGSTPSTAVRVLSDAACCLLLLDRDLDDARALMGEAEAVATANDIETVELVLARALLHHHDGNLPQAVDGFVYVVDLGRRVQDRWWECPARTRRILVDLQQRDLDGALQRAVEAERLADRMGDASEAAFARGLGAVANALLEARSGIPHLAPVDVALEELRALDDLWMLGELQAYATELALQGGHVEDARRRAGEVWQAAEALARPSLLALGRSLLARIAVGAGAPEEAARCLSAAEVADPPHRLSFRAREAVRCARTAMGAGDARVLQP